jgi:transcriptional regulator with XRE-family HTH domain
MTPAQCRAARALIGWSQEELAAASKVEKATIANFELGKRAPYACTLDGLRAALEAAGVEFINVGGQPGVKLEEALAKANPTCHYFARPSTGDGCGQRYLRAGV